MLVFLGGAKKNTGDFLIVDRACKLFSTFVDPEIVVLDRSQPLDDSLDIVNSARAVILCGGPAYAASVYPGIYPLTGDLTRIKPPIIPFGLGWCGRPMGAPETFSFDVKSLEFLHRIHNSIPASSCRDEITHAILLRQNIDNVVMTGCPVWYDLRHLGQPVPNFRPIKSIVVTAPGNPRRIVQTVQILNIVKAEFPGAKIHLTFHHGIRPDARTSVRASAGYSAMAAAGALLGASVHDVAYDLQRIQFYEDCDLHIGYRVHAHLHFLSRRRPSILINEDGRGLGMVQSMGLRMLNVGEPDLLEDIRQEIVIQKTNSFAAYQNVYSLIESRFDVMKAYLERLSHFLEAG